MSVAESADRLAAVLASAPARLAEIDDEDAAMSIGGRKFDSSVL